MTDEEIMRALWGPQSGGSHNGAERLARLLLKAESDELFWRTFQFGWNHCDDTWFWSGLLMDLMRQRPPAEPYLQGADRAFYDGLPDLVTIHRGCSKPRVRGLAWTTDRAVAERFARGHRFIPVPEPVIATAIVPKAAIFTVSAERKESEVVVNWRRLRQLSVVPA